MPIRRQLRIYLLKIGETQGEIHNCAPRAAALKGRENEGKTEVSDKPSVTSGVELVECIFFPAISTFKCDSGAFRITRQVFFPANVHIAYLRIRSWSQNTPENYNTRRCEFHLPPGTRPLNDTPDALYCSTTW